MLKGHDTKGREELKTDIVKKRKVSLKEEVVPVGGFLP